MSDYRGFIVYDPNIGLVFFNLLTSPTVAGFSRRSNLRHIINHNTEDNRTQDKGEDDRRIYTGNTEVAVQGKSTDTTLKALICSPDCYHRCRRKTPKGFCISLPTYLVPFCASLSIRFSDFGGYDFSLFGLKIVRRVCLTLKDRQRWFRVHVHLVLCFL